MGDLLAAIDGIPEERLVEPGASGAWSVKDLMGHIAFWEARAVEVARHVLVDEPVAPLDWRVVNEREAAVRASRTAAEQRAEMEHAHAAVLALIASLRPDDPKSAEVIATLPGNTNEHYDEHAAEIRAWRERVGL